MAIVKRGTADLVSDALIKILPPYKDKVKTLTFDNGSDFTYHEKIAEKLSAKTYFCNHYSSRKRGTNENTNGLIRQFFPKGADFKDVTHKKLEKIRFLINNRPRETRKCKSEKEIFKKQFIPLLEY